MLNFIEGNPMIRELHVFGDGKVDVMPSEVKRLMSEHAPLVTLKLEPYAFTADDAIKTIQELNALKEFRFQLNNELQYDQFVIQLDSEWQLVHGSKRIITVRR